jgi:hypothetical protein
MLQWVICSRRLLNIEELLEAIAFTVEDDHYDIEKIPIDLTRLIRASGNLILIDEEDHSVHLAHYTVQQFLLMSSSNVGEFSFRFTRESGEQYLGETCITYLCFKDFDTQIMKHTQRTKAHMAGVEKALLQSKSISQRGLIEASVAALSRLLRPTQPHRASNIDFSRHVREKTIGLEAKYQFLGYVVNEWLFHTSRLSFPPYKLMVELESLDPSLHPEEAKGAKIQRRFRDLVRTCYLYSCPKVS